jgi:hypothetical protein
MNAVNTVEKAETGTDAGYICPHCGKTEHTYNAVTLAAMEEAEAIARGEIQVEWQHPPATKEELKAQIRKMVEEAKPMLDY